MPEVLVPPYPGITSATGLLTSDVKYDQMQTVFMIEGRIDAPRLDRELSELTELVKARLLEDGIPDDEITVSAALDCRYVGQGYELRVPLPKLRFADDALAAFHRMHEQEYGHPMSDPIEIVNLRVTATGKRPKLGRPQVAPGELEDALLGEGESVFRQNGSLGSQPTQYLGASPAAARAGRSRPGCRLPARRDRARTAGVERDGRSVRQSATQEENPMSVAETRVDPITASVIAGALDSIAIEMGHKLARMSYSSIIRESEDFGTVVCDAHGRQLCESPQSTPLQSGPIPGYVRGINRRFAEIGEEWKPGDVVMHNHPYYGASHGPDVGFVVPVFYGGQLVGFSATTAHHLDIGALTPGSCGIVDASDAYAEGLQFTAIKVVEEGKVNEWVWHILRDNIRMSSVVVADMQAQIAAARIGAERFLELFDRYGLETVQGASDDLMDYSERVLRQEIEKLPDGTYSAEGRIDGYLDHENPAYRDLPIVASVTVDGSDLHVDLAGTAPQVDLPINMPFEGTVDIAIYLVLRSILLDSETHDPVPTNSGLFRPIKITAPEGCLANPRYPAPTIARFVAGNIIAETVMRAIAPHKPEAVAASVGNLKVIASSGIRDGGHWVHMDIVEGSYGGPVRQGRPGRSRHALREHAKQPD